MAGYPAVKTEVSEVVDYLRDPGATASPGRAGRVACSWPGRPAPARPCSPGRWPARRTSRSSRYRARVRGDVRRRGGGPVRDLFEQARARGPAIVFIDEIDALGARSDHGGFGGSDEREQTLNQLLAEMDGFDESGGVVVLAATNRPDALDPALRRPGRFDREVIVPLPDRSERQAILASHARGRPSALTSTSARPPRPPRGSPARTWPTWSTRPR